MNNLKKRIYDDISMEILNYLSKNSIKYDLKKEKEEIKKKKQINKQINKILQKDKSKIEAEERLSMRIISLCNCIEKAVTTIPRKVYFSKHLSEKIEGNINGDIIDQINIFKKKFELGEDINSNLSKGIFNSNSWDYALNIWNIRHLHLSESVEFNKNAMSKNRSNYLLFFVLKEHEVYFIDVIKHPIASGFTSFQFLEILDESHWLKLIGFEEIEEIKELELIIEKDQHIYELTKCGMNIIYKIKEKYYINVFGITSLGNKSEHTFVLNEIIKKINRLLEETEIEYIGFKLLMNGCLGVIKYKIDSNEKELIL